MQPTNRKLAVDLGVGLTKVDTMEPKERLKLINAQLPSVSQENLCWLIGVAEIVFVSDVPIYTHDGKVILLKVK